MRYHLGSLIALCASCGPRAAPSSPSAGSGDVVIDRFSARAAHIMVRDAKNGLPPPGAPIDFDRPPFITQGLAPDGTPVRYYNFDVQSDRPATLYRFVRAGARDPIAGQDDVVDVVPGDAGYSDFWRIAWVDLPADVAPGSITSAAQVRARGLAVTPDAHAIDCPIVPRGSTAREGHGVAPAAPHELVYRGAHLECLLLGDPLTLGGDGRVPLSPIYVTFAREKVFRTEPGAAAQTHNVVMSVPGDVDYSPLWAVHVYDPAAFDRVHDESSALAAPLVEPNGPHVNCPVVSVTTR